MYQYKSKVLEGDEKPVDLSHLSKPPPDTSTGGEDEDVKKFWRKLRGEDIAAMEEASDDAPSGPIAPTGDTYRERNISKQSAEATGNKDKHFKKNSALDKAVGNKARDVLNSEQMAERHPRLRNAPVEGGAYTGNIRMNHKPFCDIVRNVQCVRCGEWGHQRGDRECSLLHEVSAATLASQRQMDPLNAMKMDDVAQEKQSLILCKAAMSRLGSSASMAGAMAGGGGQTQKLYSNQSFVESDDEGGESDPEGDFLATLTKTEKKLLLKKLQVCELYYCVNACTRCVA
jgi:hypothetical protein